MGEATKDSLLASVHSTVFKESETLEGRCIKIEGYDFNKGVDYSQLLRSMVSTGFQASNLGEAIEVVNEMVRLQLYSTVLFLLHIDHTCAPFHFIEVHWELSSNFDLRML